MSVPFYEECSEVGCIHRREVGSLYCRLHLEEQIREVEEMNLRQDQEDYLEDEPDEPELATEPDPEVVPDEIYEESEGGRRKIWPTGSD